MATSEFAIIDRFFTHQTFSHDKTVLGIGDDCALLQCPARYELAITVDTLVQGVHFLPTVHPESLGHKALAVSLSDLAAMGALPAWATLALALPSSDEHWLELFSKGFFSLAARYGVELIGGDTTQGSLTITVNAMGFVPKRSALRRSGAQIGDLIYVSGYIGSAGLGLKIQLGQTTIRDTDATVALEWPEPRCVLGLCLRGLATACIDISDGLTADLDHILQASGVGAVIAVENLPIKKGVREYIQETEDWTLPLTAGDDYELCFTVRPQDEAMLIKKTSSLGYPVTKIGTIKEEKGLILLRSGSVISLEKKGYEHFT